MSESKEFTIERHRQTIAEERARLNRLFPGNENLSVYDRKIIIARYQTLWNREQYPFGRPRNLISLAPKVLK